MLQQESIYNLVPSKPLLPSHQKMYRSMYPHWIAPTASTFILSNTTYPGVANTGGSLKFPRGAHPINGNYRSMGLPKGGYKVNPEKFIRKNHLNESIISRSGDFCFRISDYLCKNL